MKYPLIGLGLSAACLLLSFGLCGASGSAGSTDNLATAGLVMLGVSIIGGTMSLIWLIVALIRGK